MLAPNGFVVMYGRLGAYNERFHFGCILRRQDSWRAGESTYYGLLRGVLGFRREQLAHHGIRLPSDQKFQRLSFKDEPSNLIRKCSNGMGSPCHIKAVGDDS